MNIDINYLKNTFSLEGRVGIVTGASRGIGAQIAVSLSQAGAKVYGFSRNTAIEDIENPPPIYFKKVDIQNENQIKQALKEILEEEHQLDFLVNNAGTTKKNDAILFSMDSWKKIQELNVNSLFRMCQLCYPYLKNSLFTGKIVNITSMAAHLGFTGVSPYCASKSAVLGLTRALAIEWANIPILVNSIAPGWIYTQMVKTVADKERIDKIINRIPLHKFGERKDIAAAVLFLLSNAGSYINGIDLPVDGGALAYGF